MSTLRTHNFWFVIRKADDVLGEWTAHCLELDVVTQGRSIDHAVEMLFEACMMVLAEDIENRRDWSERRAPEEHWIELWTMLEDAERIDRDKLAELTADDSVSIVVGQFVIRILPLSAAVSARTCDSPSREAQSMAERPPPITSSSTPPIPPRLELPALWKHSARSDHSRPSHPCV